MNTHPTQNQFAYDLIAEAIRHLEDHAGDQPSLEAVADRIGVSPTHFQKMFSQWVGVSPKRYLQYLTLDHAKGLLRDRFTLFLMLRWKRDCRPPVACMTCLCAGKQ